MTSLAFFTDIASFDRALPFANRTGYIRFARMQRAVAWSDLFSTGVGRHIRKLAVQGGEGRAHDGLGLVAAARGDWGHPMPGPQRDKFNANLKLLVDAVAEPQP